MTEIHLADDFSKHPAGRYKSDGPYSGELFREKFLEPRMKDHEKIVVYLDGARGYGSSFLEEAFGGIARKYPTDLVESLIVLDSRDSNLIQRIKSYIHEARGKNTSKQKSFIRSMIDGRYEPR
ncbi:STAS-like domain-containing protein [Pseudomonas sp. Irchel 3H9]|uniref:STAS-like domain-containing protein n=1 Tax=Pseudomonas sp. Irchel 3H9 TaxID=2009043 RepID=UPI000BA3AC86|nr:STAS-like domain-containing protein [Pseudomonas sp. Irchel 3H9]